jgi:hypothetical protein
MGITHANFTGPFYIYSHTHAIKWIWALGDKTKKIVE